MNKILHENAENLVNKIAKTAGFSNDPGLLNGKMGVAILLFHGSKYFQSGDLEKIAEFLIDDVIENKEQIFTSSEVFWAFNYLSEKGFIELDKDFFSDIDEALFKKAEDISMESIMSDPFLGIYILSRFYTSENREYWIAQAQTYLRTMLRTIHLRRGILKRNIDQFAPFWYVILKCKELELEIDINKNELGEICVIFDDLYKSASDFEKLSASFQFYILYKSQDFRYDQSWIGSIKGINNLYLNKLLYPGYIMPSLDWIEEKVEAILNDKRTLRELESLFSYQNIGITCYITGLAWTLLSYFKDHT
jgi:hypothetical protein